MTRSPIALALSLFLLAAAALPALAAPGQDAGRAEVNLDDESEDDHDADGIRNAVDRVDNRFDAAGRLLRLKVGQRVPDEAYRTAVVVDAQRSGLRPPPTGAMWLRIGGDLLLVGADGYVVDAVYDGAAADRR